MLCPHLAGLGLLIEQYEQGFCFIAQLMAEISAREVSKEIFTHAYLFHEYSIINYESKISKSIYLDNTEE